MKELKIVTFNIRTLYDEHDGVNSFIHRAGLILDKISEEKPHIICFQEVSERIRQFLNKYLTDYILVGHGRHENYDGEGLSVAILKESIELFGLEHFWLSPTPFLPASRYENQSQYPRICQRLILKHTDSSMPVRIYNVHLDHISDEARILGIRQILEKISAENKDFVCPTIIMGDFNAVPDSKTISYCREYKEFPIFELTEKLGETFHDFGGTGTAKNARGTHIDYMFADLKMTQKLTEIYKWTDPSR